MPANVTANVQLFKTFSKDGFSALAVSVFSLEQFRKKAMMEEKQNQFCVQDQKPFFVFCKDLFRNPMTGIDDDDQLVDVVSFFY